MSSSKKAKRKIEERKIEFPEISIERAIELLNKAYNEYGESRIIPVDEFQKVIDIHGGAFAGIISALKLYGLLETRKRSEYIITDLGMRIIQNITKKDVMNSWLSVKIHKKVYSEYGDTLFEINRKVVEKYLIDSEKMPEKDAVKLARLVLESYMFIEGIELEEEALTTTTEPQKEKMPGINEDAYFMGIILGGLFQPKDEAEIEIKIDSLLRLAQKNNLIEFYGLMKGIKTFLLGKTKDEMLEILNKSSGEIISTLDKSLGIKRPKLGIGVIEKKEKTNPDKKMSE